MTRSPRPPLAVCSWSLRPPDPATLVKTLRATGLDRIQLALVPLVEYRAWTDAPAVLQDAGVTIVSGMLATVDEDYSTLDAIARTGGVRPDATWEANRRRAQAVADLAGAIGIELVTFHAGFLPEDRSDPERARLVDRLRTIASIFAEAGIAVGFETGQETADTLVHVLEEIDRPNVCVNFDPANMILYGKGDPVDAVRRLGGSVRQVHVKDATASPVSGAWGTETPVGSGAVDWSSFLVEVAAIDPAMPLVIEREAGDARVDDVARACAVIEEHWPCT